MRDSYSNGDAEAPRFVNALCLQKAVLCADSDCVSDTPHHKCLVCDSRSLFNIARVLGGNLSRDRAFDRVQTRGAQAARTSVPFPRFHRVRHKIAV
jgi:hypothetical protein